MKIYRLKSWPDLPPVFKRMAYRRLLCDLSHRHIDEVAMREHAGLSGREVRSLLVHLESLGILDVKEAPESGTATPSPVVGWLLSPVQALRRIAS